MPKHKRYGSAPRPPSEKALKALDRLYGGAKQAGRDDALRARLKREAEEAEKRDRER